MATYHAGPSLADLVGLQRIDDRQCVWYNSRKAKGVSQRCHNGVKKSEVKDRIELVKKLQDLMFFDDDRKEWTLINASKVHEMLEKISKLMLCKGPKHREHSSDLYETWAEEVEESKKMNNFRETGKVKETGKLQASKPFFTADQIQQLLNIDIPGKPLCHSRSPPCRNLISSKSRTCAEDIIGKLAGTQTYTKELEQDIQCLAQLLLCKRYHQDQTSTIYAGWTKLLEELFESKESILTVSTPPRYVTVVAGTETPNSVRSTGWSPLSSTGTITPTTSPSIDRIGRINTSAPTSPLFSKHMKNTDVVPTTESILSIQEEVKRPEEQQYLLHNRVTRRTTFERKQGHLPKPLTADFEEYKSRTDIQAMKDLMKKLKANLLQSERKDGYVYGYRRAPCDLLIKVGVCDDIDSRMKDRKRQCGYTPEVVYKQLVPHARKVERLLHLCLYKERKKERSGKCDSGKGCGKTHIEWFEVTLDRLRDVGAVLQRWIGMKPYDDTDTLKIIWRKRFKNIEMSGQFETWRRWLELAPVKEGIIPEIEIKTEDKKVNIFNDRSPARVRMDIKVTNRPFVSEVEVKDESEDDGSDSLIQDMAKFSRQLNQRLVSEANVSVS